MIPGRVSESKRGGMDAEIKSQRPDDLAVDSVLEEFAEAWFSGKPLEVHAFCRRHPECGRELQKRIENFLFVVEGLRGRAQDRDPETDDSG